MSFRFYTNLVSQASRNFAAGAFIVGMLLIGFGFLIWVLRELFAMLFAVLFCIVGVGCLITGVKIFLAQRKFDKLASDDSAGYRENVHIHVEEHHDT
jgi:uncharacterized membrane protein